MMIIRRRKQHRSSSTDECASTRGIPRLDFVIQFEAGGPNQEQHFGLECHGDATPIAAVIRIHAWFSEVLDSLACLRDKVTVDEHEKDYDTH